jgi:hypothetical protein
MHEDCYQKHFRLTCIPFYRQKIYFELWQPKSPVLQLSNTPHTMLQLKQFYFLVSVFCLQTLLLQTTGCKKEYSFEGGDSTAIRNDSVILPPVVNDFPSCSICRVSDNLSLSKWNFKTGNSFVCGIIDNAGIDNEKNAFTLFGPSACSTDTGLVMTIYLPATLDHDFFNIASIKVSFFYYDRNAPKDIFISQPTEPFSVTVESFIYGSGIITGNFKGTVFKPSGATANINEGKFEAKLK